MIWYEQTLCSLCGCSFAQACGCCLSLGSCVFYLCFLDHCFKKEKWCSFASNTISSSASNGGSSGGNMTGGDNSNSTGSKKKSDASSFVSQLASFASSEFVDGGKSVDKAEGNKPPNKWVPGINSYS